MRTICSRLGAVAVAAALTLGAAGCGGGDGGNGSGSTSAASTASVAVSPAAVRRQVATTTLPAPASAPNVLGGNGEITRVLDRLDKDLGLFYSETLEPLGLKVRPATVRRLKGNGRCDGRPLKATAGPRWCQAEKAVVEPVPGAEAVRRDGGTAILYLQVAWAHAQAAGQALGWHTAVTRKRLAASEVKATEFCLMTSWIFYTLQQGLFDDQDLEVLDTAMAGSTLFAGIPQRAMSAAVKKGTNGADGCVA
jgi:hypothetical protein